MPRASLLIGIGIIHCVCGLARAADQATVAAKVGNDTISVGEVALEMRTALGERKLADDEREVLQSQTLGLLVNRQLVIQYLQKLKLGATEQQVDQQLDRLVTQLKRQGMPLEAYVEKLGITKAELRRSLTWKTGWQKYLESKLTPENVAKYFQEHHSDFDGTQVRAAHILFKVDKPSDPDAVQQVVDRAGELREQIMAKKLSFAEAAKQHSQAPTADEGGDIGLISRHEPMPEAFSEAAFELEPGQTSEPVLTTFGIHLVQCQAIEPGKLTLKDDGVEEAVREELIRYLFKWVSTKQRSAAQVEFTGALPYLDLASGKLVKAKH